MADTLSTYFAVFKADLDGFTAPLRDAQKQAKELNDAARPLTTLFKDIGDSATRFGSILSIGLTAPIVAFGAIAVKNFNESQQAIAQMEAAIISTEGAAGKTSEQLIALSKSLEAKSLRDDDEILRGIVDTLLQFGNVSGQVFDRAAQAALDLSQRLGKDLQASAILVGKALEDPVKGLTALQKVGVVFSQSQKDLIKALVDTGHAAEAQNIILDELSNKYDGAAEAASKVGTGPMKQLQIQIGNMSESWGKLITEAMNPFILRAQDVVKWIDTWSESTKVLVGSAAGIAAAIGPVVFTFGQLSLGIANTIPLITKLSTVFLGAEASAALFSTTLAAIPWVAAAAGAAAVGVGIGMITNKMIEASGYQKQFDSILNTIVKTIPGFSLLATGNDQANDSTKSYNITLKAQQDYLKKTGKSLDDLNKNLADHLKTVADFSDVMSGSSNSIKEAGKASVESTPAFKKFREEIDRIKESVTGSAKEHGNLITAIKEMEKAGVPLEAITAKLGSAIKNEYDQAKLLHGEMDPTIQKLHDFATAQQSAKDKTEATSKEMKSLVDIFIAAQPVTQQLQDHLESISEIKGPKRYVEGMQDLIDITKAANAEVVGLFDRTAEGTQVLADAVDVNAVRIKDAHKNTTDSIQKVWETAAGNITSGMAKAFTDILFHGGSFLDKMVDLAKSVAEQMLNALLVGLFAPLTAKLAGLGSTLGSMIPGLGGIGGAVGSAGTAAGGAAGTISMSSGGGIGGAIGGLLTNPWTIGIGAGLIGITTWLKSQAHHEANQLVQQIENPFWAAWGKILPTDRYSELSALPYAQAKSISEQLMALNANYMALGSQFALGGSDEKKVWEQSLKNTQPPLQGVLNALAIAEAAGPAKPAGPQPGPGSLTLEQMYPSIKGLATGTNYVPKTAPYILHEGEAVIPADQNIGGGISINGDIHLHGIEDPEGFMDELVRMVKDNRYQAKSRLRYALG